MSYDRLMIRRLLIVVGLAAALTIPATVDAASPARPAPTEHPNPIALGNRANLRSAGCIAIYHSSENATIAGCAGLTFGYEVRAYEYCQPPLAWQPKKLLNGNLVGNYPAQSTTFSCAGTVTAYGYTIVYVGS